MEQQKMTDEQLNRELKGNKAASTVCKIIGKCLAVLAFICAVTGQIPLAVILFIIAVGGRFCKRQKGYCYEKADRRSTSKRSAGRSF